MDSPSVFLSKTASYRNLSDTFTRQTAPRNLSSAHLVHFCPALGTCLIFSPFYRLSPSLGVEAPGLAQLRAHVLGQGFLSVLWLLPGMRISGRSHCGLVSVIRTLGSFLPSTQTSATGLCWPLLINSHWPNFCPPISGTSVPQEHRLPRCQSLGSVS